MKGGLRTALNRRPCSNSQREASGRSGLDGYMKYLDLYAPFGEEGGGFPRNTHERAEEAILFSWRRKETQPNSFPANGFVCHLCEGSARLRRSTVMWGRYLERSQALRSRQCGGFPLKPYHLCAVHRRRAL